MDKKKLQMLQLMQAMGVDLNPINQMSSLVKLINESEGPQNQQQQFERKMTLDEQNSLQDREFREKSFGADQDYRGNVLDMRREENESMNQYRQQAPWYGLIGTGLGLQHDLNVRGFNPDPFAALVEMLGLPGFFGAAPQGPQGYKNPDISDEDYNAAMAKNGLVR